MPYPLSIFFAGSDTAEADERVPRRPLEWSLVLVIAAAVVVVFLQAVWRSSAVRMAVVALDRHLGLVLKLTVVVVGALWVTGLRLRMPRPVRDAVLLSAALVIFLVPLIHDWSATPAVPSTIAKLVPDADAQNYYSGAVRLLITGETDAWNTRRPLNVTLLAVRLALVRGDFRLSLLLQTLLLAGACYLLAAVVARDGGLPAGLLLFAVCHDLGEHWVSVALSESLGMSFGALAAAVLWESARRQRLRLAACGAFLMTLAVSARAGAMLVLPALVLWGLFGRLRDDRRIDWRAGLVICLAVALALVLDTSLRAVYGIGAGVGHGNFSMTLYGLSTGRPDWTRLFRDFPGSRGMEETARNAFAYRQALANIRREPTALLRGLWGGWLSWMKGLWQLLYVTVGLRLHGDVVGFLNRFLVFALLFGMVRWLWLNRRRRSLWLLGIHAAAVIVSGAVVFVDAGPRVMIASYPLLFIPVAFAFAGWRRRLPEAVQEEKGVPAVAARIAAVGGLTLAGLALVGPPVAHALHPSCPAAELTEADDRAMIVSRVHSGVAHIEIRPTLEPEQTFLPLVSQRNMQRLAQSYQEPVYRLTGPVTLMYVADRSRRPPRFHWLVAPPEILDGEARCLRITGRARRIGDRTFLYVSDWQEIPETASGNDR